MFNSKSFVTRIIHILILLIISNSINGQNNTGKLKVEITGISGSKGNILLTIFNKNDGFPADTDKAYIKKIGKIINGKCQIIINKLPFGSYAIAVIHDENKNGEIDTNFIGIPTEGAGASNNAKGMFGPPKYKDAEFDFRSQGKTIHIKMVYM